MWCSVTNRFQLVSFEAEHFFAITPRPEENELGRYKAQLVNRLLSSASAYTLLYDGRPLVCGGCLLYWNGVAEIWLHGSEEVMRHPAAVFRLALRLIALWTRQFALHRIQITVADGFPASVRFAKALGFDLESTLLKYGPNKETFYRFVRFPEPI